MEPGKDQPGWKWASLNQRFDPNNPEDDWVQEGAVKIEDLERTLGRYLHGAIDSPQSAQ